MKSIIIFAMLMTSNIGLAKDPLHCAGKADPEKRAQCYQALQLVYGPEADTDDGQVQGQPVINNNVYVTQANPTKQEQKTSGKELVKTQEEYDDYMKSAGKYDFISDAFFLMTIVSVGATYYSLDKSQKYDDLKNQRPLTSAEQQEAKKWDSYTQAAAGAAGGCLIFGLVTYGVQVHYERKAHTFAIESGISW